METKDKDIYTIEMYGASNDVRLEYASYNCNGTLALQMFSKADEDEIGFYAQDGCDVSDPYQVPYGVATVNLPESEMLAVNEQFVDENNLPGIGRWLQRNNIAEPTGQMAFSGYCCYQAYRFNVPEASLDKVRSARQERNTYPQESQKSSLSYKR